MTAIGRGGRWANSEHQALKLNQTNLLMEERWQTGRLWKLNAVESELVGSSSLGSSSAILVVVVAAVPDEAIPVNVLVDEGRDLRALAKGGNASVKGAKPCCCKRVC